MMALSRRLRCAAEPLDLVRIDIGSGDLHRRRQVEDCLALRGGLPDIQHGFANLEHEGQFGAGERFRGILEAEIRLRLGSGQLEDQRCGIDRELHGRRFILAEHDPAEHRRGGVIEVNDGARCAPQRLEGATDQFRAGRGQDLDRDVIRDEVLLDQLADEIEIGL